MTLTVRMAVPSSDAAQCAAISAPHLRDGVASVELEPPSVAEIEQRMRDYAASRAWLFAELDDDVLGMTQVRVYREVGYKHGRWHDVGWWQRLL